MLPDRQEMAPEYLAPSTFESSRLIYRGIEKDDVDFFFKLCSRHSSRVRHEPKSHITELKKGGRGVHEFC